MPYIYKITNKINGKIYIGKTLKTVEQRWKEHVHDYKRDVMKKRPLYSAINKYGPENFTAEEIEECSAEKLSEREQYWIKFYHSYEDGYNATMGGDGKQYIDYDRIYHLYGQGKLIKEINDITHHDKGTISKILSIKGVSSEDRKNNAHSRIRKKVAKIDLQTGKILEIFPSLTAAGKSISQGHEHIGQVCNNKRKSCGGFGWKFLEPEPQS